VWLHFGINRIKGLILGAGGDILLGEDGQKPFQFMFTWQMQRQRHQSRVPEFRTFA
jgi:hypothetical protein